MSSSPLGVFDPQLVPAAWFAPEQIRIGWFHESFVGAVASTAGYIKVWNGTSWESKPVKVWSGSAWEIKPLKWWTGTAWQLT